MDYFTAKALHLIGMVAWFAGLFYIPRLFIYDVEADERPPAVRDGLRDQLRIMQRRLWYGITWPAMLFTLTFGIWMVVMQLRLSGVLQPWLHLKLTLVLALVIYHLMCGRIRRKLLAGSFTWTSQHLRMWNELATLLLVAMVFIAVKKSSLDALWSVVGLIIFAASLMVAIRVYRRIRQKRATGTPA